MYNHAKLKNSPVRGLKILVAGLVCFTLLATTGCNKMLAKQNLKGATKRRDEAVNNQAVEFTANLLEETNNQINEATDLINTGQYKEARTAAKEASERSKVLLNNTKIQYSNHLKNQANTWLKIVDKNQGKQENPTLYGQIQTGNQQGLEYIEKEKHDSAIKTLSKVYDDIQFLLQNLKNESIEGLAEANQMKQDLVNEEAENHAPEFVQKMQGHIDEIKRFIEVEFDFRNAINTRNLARQDKQEGIQKTKEVKSQKQIVIIENLLDTATDLGAEIFALQSFREISKDFENMLTQFYDRNYDTVLSLAPNLLPEVEDLIVETKREAARAEMNAVKGAIELLVDEKARTYLPGRVEQLEALLEEASGLFEGEQYAESKEVSKRALELNIKITGDYDDLTAQHIARASEKLGAAELVFNRMADIFSQKIPGDWQGEERALEDGKLAMKEELQAQLTSTQLSLGLAELKREVKDFDLSIETAREVVESADDVTRQTYRVVAHNSILEIANDLTRYERDGAREYAPAELEKTGAILEDTKALMRMTKYREAVARAGDTHAQLEIMVQELERVAVNRIEIAREALLAAKDSKAEEYENDTYAQALVAQTIAEDSLLGGGLKNAIESAIQSEQIAIDARSNSLRKWSEGHLEESQRLLDRGQQAGADVYAPERMLEARELRRNLQALYDSGNYGEAIIVGDQAVQQAHNALYAKVIEAENAIATAKRFYGWEYEKEKLADVIVEARQARQALDDGQFDQSRSLASGAISGADSVTHSAKRKSFHDRMSTLNSTLKDAQKVGAGYYQVNDLSAVLDQIQDLKSEFDPEQYEDFANKVNLLEAQLAGLVEMTPQVLTDLVLAMQERLDELEARGARTYLPEKVNQVELKVKYSQMDYRNQDYRSSYRNARDAQELLAGIMMHLNEREFDARLNQHMKEFTDELRDFSPILNLGSATLIRMVIGPKGQSQALALIEATSPSDLRTRITEIGTQVKEISSPPSRIGLHRASLEMLAKAQLAATNFEKLLILDLYNTNEARKIIQVAFRQIHEARQEQQQIQHGIEYPQIQFKPMGVQQVISFRGF
jgi:hypothetical protein